MSTPDPKYLPKAKPKNKPKKAYVPKVAGPSFPVPTKAIEKKTPKHKSPRGDSYVWGN